MELGAPIADGVISLRPPDERDLDAIDALIRDPDVVHWLGPPPGTAAEVLALNQARAVDGSPTFAIRGSGDHFLGLAWVNLNPTEPAAGSIGYSLLANARGQGFATRAVRLVVDHAVRVLGMRRVVLITDVANQPSRRVAVRAGFEHTATRLGTATPDGRSGDVAVYTFPVGVR
jgi:RimJ/RimL family protein N-acetyltransferase